MRTRERKKTVKKQNKMPKIVLLSDVLISWATTFFGAVPNKHYMPASVAHISKPTYTQKYAFRQTAHRQLGSARVRFV